MANWDALMEDVEEHPRHLRYRDAVISKVIGSTPTKAKAGNVVPDDAVHCDTCFAWVSDLDAHVEAVHS